MIVALLLALGTPAPALPAHCLDSFLGVGEPLAPPRDVLRRVERTKPDRIVRIDALIAQKIAGTPIVGFVYVSQGREAFFGTRTRRNEDARVRPLVRQIYTASSTASQAQVQALLRHQDGNAIVYLARPLKLLRGLGLRAARCAVLGARR